MPKVQRKDIALLHIQQKTQNKKHPTSPEIADFARYRLEFFGKYIDLSNGLPTYDTLRCFFQNLDPRPFRARFAEWVSSIVRDGAQGKAVSIDGKRVRKASEMNGGNPALHLLRQQPGKAG